MEALPVVEVRTRSEDQVALAVVSVPDSLPCVQVWV